MMLISVDMIVPAPYCLVVALLLLDALINSAQTVFPPCQLGAACPAS